MYNFYGIYIGESMTSITIYDNRNQNRYYNGKHSDYIEKNFKFLNEQEYKQEIRKLKLKKISK